MAGYDTFDEATFFSFVDNPSITYAKDAELIKEEYKETPVISEIMLRLRIGCVF